MRAFEKADWYGFSGAEADDEHPAMIGGNDDAVIVADLMGVAVYWQELGYFLPVPYATAVAIAEAVENAEKITHELLTKWGFKAY